MAEYIATGTAAANGADFTLAEDAEVNLSLFSGSTTASLAHDCQASIQNKTSAGGYLEIGMLTAKTPTLLLSGPGTFRVRKPASTTSFGVDKT